MTAKTARAARSQTNQQASLSAFLREKSAFDALVAELQQMSADHLGADPDAILWTEAARLAAFNTALRQITDSYFKRGEYAA